MKEIPKRLGECVRISPEVAARLYELLHGLLEQE